MTKKALILLLAGSLLTAGCGGGAKSDTKAALATAAETAAAAYDVAAEGGFQEEMWEGEDMAAPIPVEGAWNDSGQIPTEGPAEAPSGVSSLGIQNPGVSARKLIRNVYMNVETDAFDALISQIQSKVTELAGYMEQSDISGSSITFNNVRPDRYASITARIPADKLDLFIAVVEDSGNVTNRSESTQDVTLQYSDLESRKKTLSMEQERIWALLEKADTLEAVIALEEHLSEIRYELESMESRLKLYDNQVAYSTIEISVHEVLPVDFTPVAPETIPQRIRKGFMRNVKNVSEFVTDLFVGLITGIPVWLPLLAALALILTLSKRILGKNNSLSWRGRKNSAVLSQPHKGPSMEDTAGADSSEDQKE